MSVPKSLLHNLFVLQIKGLRIWKMQLLDEQHILIKYASEEVVTLRSSEPNAQVYLDSFLIE